MELIAGLAVGLVAGAWVDRLRRRPVMIWTDLGRAALLATIPLAAFGGWLSLPQLLLVAFLIAVLTTFFDYGRSRVPAFDRPEARPRPGKRRHRRVVVGERVRGVRVGRAFSSRS